MFYLKKIYYIRNIIHQALSVHQAFFMIILYFFTFSVFHQYDYNVAIHFKSAKKHAVKHRLDSMLDR